MEIILPPELEKFVEAQVNTGKYASADAVILAGIELLAQRKEIDEEYLPQTPLGKELWRIRQRAIAAGMQLADAEDIADEISSQRNRHSDLDKDLS
jgi:putative addiction module CopG family antidote